MGNLITFLFTDNEYQYEQIEPIWVTAELQNVTTAIMGWPGNYQM